jgi:hypothetical protein
MEINGDWIIIIIIFEKKKLIIYVFKLQFYCKILFQRYMIKISKTLSYFSHTAKRILQHAETKLTFLRSFVLLHLWNAMAIEQDKAKYRAPTRRIWLTERYFLYSCCRVEISYRRFRFVWRAPTRSNDKNDQNSATKRKFIFMSLFRSLVLSLPPPPSTATERSKDMAEFSHHI